jgi:hypothetical protein
MFTRAKSLGNKIGMALMVGVCVCAFAAVPALAQTNSQSGQSSSAPIGELLVAHGASVDGLPAMAGLTFVNGSNIKIDAGGWATVNLGHDGRIKLGPDSEMVVTTAPAKIGGTLLNGWAVVSASKGVEVAIKTLDGMAVADGHQPTVLTIDLVAGNTRVESRSEAKVAAGLKTESVAAGEEVTVERSAEPGGAATISRNALGAARSVNAQVVPVSKATEMASLMASSVRQSISTIALDRTSDRTAQLAAGGRSINSTEALRVTSGQAVDTGCSPNPCPNCQVTPGTQSADPNGSVGVVKARAGCQTFFNVGVLNLPVGQSSTITIKPFSGNACFRLIPPAGSVITVPAGGVFPITLDATNCPVDAFKQPQNAEIIVTTSTCGVSTLMVEWATPCRR